MGNFLIMHGPAALGQFMLLFARLEFAWCTLQPRILVQYKVATKVIGPNSVTYLNQTPIVQCCMVQCRSKNGHENDMCFRGSGLRDQNLCGLRQFIPFKISSKTLWD